MAEEPDVIRQQIDDTRDSLTDKLQTLEGQVKDAVGTVSDTLETVKNTVEDTVETVRSTVENTVDSVKSGVESTVDSVKETLNLSRQVAQHPWTALGCSLVAGIAAGYLFGRRSTHSPGIPGMSHLIPGYQSGPAPGPGTEAPRIESPGFLAALAEPLAGEWDRIKQTAIGAFMGLARDALKDVLPPSLAPNVEDIMDGATRTAGGAPIRGPVLRHETAGHNGGAT